MHPYSFSITYQSMKSIKGLVPYLIWMEKNLVTCLQLYSMWKWLPWGLYRPGQSNENLSAMKFNMFNHAIFVTFGGYPTIWGRRPAALFQTLHITDCMHPTQADWRTVFSPCAGASVTPIPPHSFFWLSTIHCYDNKIQDPPGFIHSWNHVKECINLNNILMKLNYSKF